ncbi:MAG: XisI protein [Desulfobacteraceae bacterium]|nr:XisI protein [Desulfobacteraceae bacterium]
MAFRVGWRKHKRIHLCLVHIDICNDMVVIQANNTEDMIDSELVDMGIPKDKICLGLLPPDVRQYVEQAKAKPFDNRQIIAFRPTCQAA